ncbi:hypothetical protein BJ878DRAFT_483468 [Calycina marina]|uniref:Uncharacterized protein n=1 Tax=Calycina marina TaxID=1763456 RepID=A0A9P7YWA6_9HELO|nr:hypothetical protein BJ878DRAFT_483468 [Calycina marina]
MEGPGPPSPSFSQNMGEEDVNMREAPETPSQHGFVQEPQIVELQEPERSSTDAEMQENEKEALFVPAEPTTQRIRFVCRKGKKSESEMFDPLRRYLNERIIQIPCADLASRVVEVVEMYLAVRMRACDKHKKYIPTEECYNFIAADGNNHTLFFIPDEEYKRRGQSLDVLEGAMEQWPDDEIHQETRQEQEVEQNLEGDLRTTNALEEPHHEEAIPDAALLDSEKENAANAHILGRDNTIIYLKKRVGDSHDISKPAEDWSWVDVQLMDVPIGDPQDIVERTLRRLWQEVHLKPHDKNLRTLEYGDCYKVTVEADDHTLYLMVPSPQIEEERAAERTWIAPLPLPAGVCKRRIAGGWPTQLCKRRATQASQALILFRRFLLSRFHPDRTQPNPQRGRIWNHHFPTHLKANPASQIFSRSPQG